MFPVPCWSSFKTIYIYILHYRKQIKQKPSSEAALVTLEVALCNVTLMKKEKAAAVMVVMVKVQQQAVRSLYARVR
jgi:hypothetical protein